MAKKGKARVQVGSKVNGLTFATRELTPTPGNAAARHALATKRVAKSAEHTGETRSAEKRNGKQSYREKRNGKPSYRAPAPPPSGQKHQKKKKHRGKQSYRAPFLRALRQKRLACTLPPGKNLPPTTVVTTPQRKATPKRGGATRKETSEAVWALPTKVSKN